MRWRPSGRYWTSLSRPLRMVNTAAPDRPPGIALHAGKRDIVDRRWMLSQSLISSPANRTDWRMLQLTQSNARQ